MRCSFVPTPSANSKTRLLNPWAVLVVTGALGGLLWFTFQDEKVFAPGDREPDQVSLNYAQLLLNAHPGDDELRLRLVEQLLTLGDYAAARSHVQAWPQPEPAVQAYYLARIDALSLAPGADPLPVLTRLDALDISRLSPPQLASLAQVQLQRASPGSAATTYAHLAQRDPAQRPQWLASQAQWAVAAGDPAQAADVYAALVQSSADPAQARDYLQQAFAQYVAADQGERGVTLLRAHLALLDATDIGLLEQGVAVAIAHQHYDSAQALLDHWRSVQPDNPALALKVFELHLAANDLPGAWASGQALVAAQPDDMALLRRVAEVGEWVGAKAEALRLWLALWQRTGDEHSREQAWRLALLLDDNAQAISLLAPISTARPLSADEMNGLLYGYARAQQPGEAERWLRDYLRRYPTQREAWQALLANLQARTLDSAQADVWAQIQQRFGLTPAQRVAWADAHLRGNNPQGAWTALQTDPHAIDDRRFWRSRASVAWALGDREHLREALERLLALDGRLPAGDRSVLVDDYRQRDPARALQLALDGWRQAPARDSLLLALQVTLEQRDWQQLRQLLDEADQHRELPLQLQYVLARGALASHDGRPDDAARVYREGLVAFPENSLLREQLLWVYLDQRNLAELAPRVAEWREAALADPLLWLPMASAQSALGNLPAALAWYRRAARQQPKNWLAQAAYADALDAAGYQDTAWRWRRTLLRTPPKLDRQCTSCLQTWLRLLANGVSPVRAERQAWQWQDGSPAMLQLWFDQQLASLAASGAGSSRDEWLTWARQSGLKVDPGEGLQQAIRGAVQSELEPLLARADLPAGQRADMLARLGRPGAARQVNAEAWALAGSDQAADALREQAVQLEAAHPQGAQLGWKRQDFGGLRIDGAVARVGLLFGEQSYADVTLSEGRYQSDQLLSGRLGQEHNLLATLEHGVDDGRYALILDASLRDDHDRTGLGLARTWLLAPGQQLEAGLDWHRQSEETGLMRTFGQRDQLYAGGRHAITARDELSWRVGQKHFSTREGDSLGNGQAVSVVLNHVLEQASPHWAVRTGVDYQRNQLSGRTLDGLSSRDGGALDVDSYTTAIPGVVTPQDLLQARYGQVFVGSTWRRGSPGALARTQPGFSWLLDTNAGWQWEDQTFNYGVAGGVGVGVLGGDELALKLGYQSAPQGADGKAGGVLNISYSVRLGD